MASHDGKYKNLDFYKISPFYNLEYHDFAHIFVCVYNDQFYEQAGAELGQAQLQLELGFTLINVCNFTLMIPKYHYIS